MPLHTIHHLGTSSKTSIRVNMNGLDSFKDRKQYKKVADEKISIRHGEIAR